MELIRKVPVARYECQDTEMRASTEWVVSEVWYHLIYGGQEISCMPASPHMLRELAYGFLVGSGNIQAGEDISIDVQGEIISVRKKQTSGPHYSRDGTEHELNRAVTLSPDIVLEAVARLSSHSHVWKKTHGVHSVALITGGGMRYLVEDVSRHSAFDKAVGKAFMEQVDLAACFLATTCRISGSMVVRAAHSGISVLVSTSTVTGLAIEQALQETITLVGFTQKDHFVIFTHPERIIF